MKISEVVDVSIRADKVRQQVKDRLEKQAQKPGSKSILTKKIKAK